MATAPKRSPKSSQAAPKTKTVKTTRKKVSSVQKLAARVSSATKSKQTASEKAFWQRTRTIFYVVLVAAMLLAISVGLMTYQASNASVANSSNDGGAFYLESADAKSQHKAGDILDVTLYETSGSQEVNALQAGVRYPSEQLQLTSVKTETAFPQEAATDTATPGLVQIARSIVPGTAPVSGAKAVATVSFKVLADSTKPFELTIDDSRSLLVSSSDSKNILSLPSTALSL